MVHEEVQPFIFTTLYGSLVANITTINAIFYLRVHRGIRLLRTEIQHESVTDSAGGPAPAWGLAEHWEPCDGARMQETSGL